MSPLPLFVAFFVACLTLAASAQAPVYRCGSSYSQQPCPGGSTVDVQDSRTPSQRQAHRASVQQERRAGDSLEKDRLKQEAAAARARQQAEKAERAQATARKSATDKKKKSPAGQDKLPAYATPRTPASR